jgi:hypothetical protein
VSDNDSSGMVVGDAELMKTCIGTMLILVLTSQIS